MRRNELQRNAKALKTQLEKSGYEPEAIEKFVQERTEQQKSNMNKAVIKLFFRNSEFNIVPKAFNSWMEFV
jgi:DNA polymerase III delta subunit